MANELAPMIMMKYKPEFSEFDYSTYLNSPYDVTVPLQAIQQEAGAKGMGVVVQISLVPLSEIFGEEQPEEEKPDRPPEDVDNSDENSPE